MRWYRVLMLGIVLVSAMPAYAVQPDEVLANPTLEARARALSRELRCMVCQNQSIDDSDAPLARDLRLLVRERLSAGDSDRQVIDFLVARYGEFVLLRPRLSRHTFVLWLGPPILLVLGATALLILARRRSASLAADAGKASALTPADLTAAERARLADLLDRKGP